MLAHRLRRWANIKPTLGKCHVFFGIRQNEDGTSPTPPPPPIPFQETRPGQQTSGSYLINSAVRRSKGQHCHTESLCVTPSLTIQELAPHSLAPALPSRAVFC